MEIKKRNAYFCKECRKVTITVDVGEGVTPAFIQCPYCGIDYYDEDDRYLNRINRNKRLYTSVKCLCGQKFYVTYDIKGDFVAFKDSKQLPEIV